MKTCFKCQTKKPLSDFYKHSKMIDGHVNKCKECNKKDVRLNYRKNIDHFKKYDQGRAMLPHRVEARKKYVQTDKGMVARKRGTNKYREKHPEKYKAHSILCYAIMSGKLKKQPCYICGDMHVHGHHYDYSKPLDVIWLCPTHHRWIHT